MASTRDCSCIVVLFCISFCLASAHRLLLEPHDDNLAFSLAQEPAPSSLAQEPAPSSSSSGKKPSLAQEPAPDSSSSGNNLQGQSLAPSLAPAFSPWQYAASLSLAPNLAPSGAVSSSLTKHITKPVSEPMPYVRPGQDPTTGLWFSNGLWYSHPREEKPISMPRTVTPRKNPTDQQHKHSITMQSGGNRAADLRKGSYYGDLISGGTSSKSPSKTGHGNPEDMPFSTQHDSMYARSSPGVTYHAEEDALLD